METLFASCAKLNKNTSEFCTCVFLLLAVAAEFESASRFTTTSRFPDEYHKPLGHTTIFGCKISRNNYIPQHRHHGKVLTRRRGRGGIRTHGPL